jgi:hypothetical protein
MENGQNTYTVTVQFFFYEDLLTISGFAAHAVV